MSISSSAAPTAKVATTAERAARRKVALPGFAVLEETRTFNIDVVDLSYDGCKIDTPVALLPGLKLVISVLNLGAVDVEVRWYAGGQAGLRFTDTASAARNHAPRNNQRHPINAEVSQRRRGGQSYQARLYDLAITGCKTEFVERPRRGEHLWVKFEDLESLEARVCWVEQHVGGIEFVRPFHPAVFEMLLARLQA